MKQTKAEIKAYYDYHTLGKLRGFIYTNDRVERAWATLIEWQNNNPKRVLEIGCGIGDIAWRASNFWKEAEVVAFDISEVSIEIGKKMFKRDNLFFIRGDSLSEIVLGNKEKFDLIYLVDVYEHIPVEEREMFFAFINNNLSDKGMLFLSCPTVNHQQWLKDTNEKGLQPIDHDITLNELIEISRGISRNIFLYKEVSVWHVGDYLHVFFGRRNFDGKIPVVDMPKKVQQKGLKTQIKERLKDKLKGKKEHHDLNESIEKRIELIYNALGADAIQKINGYKL